jgi:hypothetical protein
MRNRGQDLRSRWEPGTRPGCFRDTTGLSAAHPRKQPNCLAERGAVFPLPRGGRATVHSSQSDGQAPSLLTVVRSRFFDRIGCPGSPGAMPSSRSQVQILGSWSASRHSRTRFAKHFTPRHARLDSDGTMMNEPSFITRRESVWNSFHVCVVSLIRVMMTET